MSQYLDLTGLTYFANKIKALINSVQETANSLTEVVSKLNKRVIMTTITGKTDSYGYLYAPSISSTRYVLSASIPGSVVIPFIGSANYWQFKVLDGNLNAKASQEFTITIVYAKKEYLE